MELILSRSDIERIATATAEVVTDNILARLKPADAGAKEWLSNREAMAFLGLSKTTLQRYRTSGRLPYAKLGGSIFYRYSDLVSVLEANLVD